jgi:3-deoxy-D-arabino-heptulosonate 7-phosphate (DAHP) synthase class II
MTPILARQVEELTLEVLSLQAEIKSKNEILDSIKNTLLSIYPVQRADEVVKLKKQLAQKEKEMAEFKKVLQDVIKTNK